jgi:dihydrofolate reductase
LHKAATRPSEVSHAKSGSDDEYFSHGFVAGPHGHAGWLAEPEELKRWKLKRIRRAGTHIMGRVTYEEMAAHWPASTDDYAAPMNEIPKVVFSKTLDEAIWPESSIARGELADEIASLRREPGGRSLPWAAPASLNRYRGPDSSTNTFS